MNKKPQIVKKEKITDKKEKITVKRANISGKQEKITEKKEKSTEKKIINISCKYNDKSFEIKIPENESLLNLKHYLVQNLEKECEIYTYDVNLSIRYGFPPKKIEGKSCDSKTLPELQIGDKECLRIELVDPQLIRHSKNEVIDYSKYKVKKKSIPADNSCLFNAINFAINQSINEPEIIRGIISSEILQNPNEFNAAILERDPEDYCDWIMRGDSWGGGIEISILSKYFGIKIGVVDIQHLTIEYFGEGFECIYLLYNNVHYDVFYFENEQGKESGLFKSDDENTKKEILDISAQLQKHSQFIDRQNFSIKCMDCNFLMNGENEIKEHTKKTGHFNFVQI